jgi:multiple sugar transport system substrate-binding protein
MLRDWGTAKRSGIGGGDRGRTASQTPATRRRVLVGLAAAASAGGVLASCDRMGATPDKASVFKERVTLHYQSYKNPEELAVFMQAVDGWAQRVGNVEVKTDIVPQGEYIEKLLVRITAGDPPDMMEVVDRMSSDFIVRGTLLDLTSLIRRDSREVDLDDFFPGFRDAMLYKGKRYGLADYCGPTVMYYNKLLFQQAAQPFPDESWDWNKFLEVGRIITKDTTGDRVPNQFMSTNSLGASKSWTPMVWWSFGGDLQKGFGPHHPSEVEWRIDRPADIAVANAQAVEFWGSLIFRHNIIPQSGQTASMREGTIATEIAGRWLVPPYKTWDWVQQGHMAMALPPKGPKGRRVRNATLSAAIPYNAKQVDPAWELLKFHTGREGLTVAVEGQRTNSPRKSVMEAFRRSLLPWESFEVYAKANELFTQPMPMHYNWTLSEQIFSQEINAAYRGEKAPAQALKEVQSRLGDLMKQGL